MLAAADAASRDRSRPGCRGVRRALARALAAARGAALGAAALAGVSACDETAVVLELRSALTVPGALDAICLSVAAIDAAGDDGAFAETYLLVGDRARLPQTLTVLPGGHAGAQVWARGRSHGVEVARAGARISFAAEEVTRRVLDLGACAGGPAGDALAIVANVAAPGAGGAAVAIGWRAPVTLLVGGAPGQVARVRAAAGALTAEAAGLPPATDVAGVLLSLDVDGDCDDDLIVAAADGPRLWRQDGDGAFAAEPGAFTGAPAVVLAVAAGDVDADGDLDLAMAGGADVRLLLNDGAGRFDDSPAAIPAGSATDATALAFGDVTGDGHLDLIVGQGGASAAPLRVLAADPSGTVAFGDRPGLAPALPQRARHLAARDLDADGDVDLLVGGAGAPLRLYVNRGDGRLEDRSYARLPGEEAIEAASLAIGDLDGDCVVDVVVGLAAGGVPLYLRGSGSGEFVAGTLPAAAVGPRVVLEDLDGDGRRDLLVAGAEGATWVGR